MAKNPPEPVQAPIAGKNRWLLEALLLIWTLASLGYFYYTQLLQPLWTQFFG